MCYDYRVVLASDQSTVSDAYSMLESADEGAWELLEPTDSSSEMGEESRSDAGRRTSGRMQIPNVRNFDQLG